ncbi:MAG: PIN domain-containing protein [Candidatus Methylomirabilis sp.]|nr:PIN domain-containing protein [Candidatus Methylomirabilis sp.]
MSDKVLVDTSAWIEFFRGTPSTCGDKVGELLRRDRTCVTGLIIVELSRGAKGTRELRTLDELLRTVTSLEVSDDVYRKAGELSYRMARRGLTLGTVDAVIAATAIRHDCPLLTLDDHFQQIRRFAPLHLA